jgi:hypothetical protein
MSLTGQSSERLTSFLTVGGDLRKRRSAISVLDGFLQTGPTDALFPQNGSAKS